MTRRFCLFVSLYLMGFCAATSAAVADPPLDAPSGIYRLEKTHASLLWRVSHMGMSTYTAKFTRFDVTLSYNASDVSLSSVEATVDLASIETGYPGDGGRDFDAELRGPSFFNAALFPKATFSSKSVVSTGPRTLIVSGQLVLLGVTQPMVLQVVLNGARQKHPLFKTSWIGVSAIGIVQRKPFGLDPMPQLTGIGNDVQVDINAELVGP